jgi:hypothetical protein
MDEVELMTGETFRKIDIAIPEIFVVFMINDCFCIHLMEYESCWKCRRRCDKRGEKII